MLNELLKALYNSNLGLKDSDKVELIETAQELFLPQESARSCKVELMTSNDILNLIVKPFNGLMRRERMNEIRMEHDRDLTHKPVLSKHSHQIAQNRYKADLDKSQDAMAVMA